MNKHNSFQDHYAYRKKVDYFLKCFPGKHFNSRYRIVLLQINIRCLDDFFYKRFRRLLNFFIALLASIVVSPIFLMVVLLAFFAQGRPVFFLQKRIGRGGKKFDMWKFRTMEQYAEENKEKLKNKNERGQKAFKMKNDPRITPLGKILRKTSLDELPQLCNVLRGEMNLVGPRPALIEEAACYSLDEKKRLSVDPGMTGLWQISGRSEIEFSKQVHLDEAYIRNQSLKVDLQILLKTIPVVISGRGAY